MGVVQRLLGFGGQFERRTAVTSSSLSSASSSSSFYKSYMSSVLFLTTLQGFWMPWILIHHQPQGTHPSMIHLEMSTSQLMVKCPLPRISFSCPQNKSELSGNPSSVRPINCDVHIHIYIIIPLISK